MQTFHSAIKEKAERDILGLLSVPENRRDTWPYNTMDGYDEGGFEEVIRRVLKKYQAVSQMLFQNDTAVALSEGVINNIIAAKGETVAGIVHDYNASRDGDTVSAARWERQPHRVYQFGGVTATLFVRERHEASYGRGSRENAAYYSEWQEWTWAFSGDINFEFRVIVDAEKMTPKAFYAHNRVDNAFSTPKEGAAFVEAIHTIVSTVSAAIKTWQEGEKNTGVFDPSETQEEAKWRVLGYCEHYGLPPLPEICEWEGRGCQHPDAENIRYALHLYDGRNGQRLTETPVAIIDNSLSRSGEWLYVSAQSWERDNVQRIIDTTDARYIHPKWDKG